MKNETYKQGTDVSNSPGTSNQINTYTPPNTQICILVSLPGLMKARQVENTGRAQYVLTRKPYKQKHFRDVLTFSIRIEFLFQAQMHQFRPKHKFYTSFGLYIVRLPRRKTPEIGKKFRGKWGASGSEDWSGRREEAEALFGVAARSLGRHKGLCAAKTRAGKMCRNEVWEWAQPMTLPNGGQTCYCGRK
jgi:hypothetical protein